MKFVYLKCVHLYRYSFCVYGNIQDKPITNPGEAPIQNAPVPLSSNVDVRLKEGESQPEFEKPNSIKVCLNLLIVHF